MSNFNIVFADFDDTIVASYGPFYIEAFNSTVIKLYEISKVNIQNLSFVTAKDKRTSSETIWKKYVYPHWVDKNVTEEEALKICKEIYTKIIDKSSNYTFKLNPQIEDLLLYISHQNIPFAIITNNVTSLVYERIKKIEINGRRLYATEINMEELPPLFNDQTLKVVGSKTHGVDLSYSKPLPNSCIEALKLFNISPKNTNLKINSIFIGDSLSSDILCGFNTNKALITNYHYQSQCKSFLYNRWYTGAIKHNQNFNTELFSEIYTKEEIESYKNKMPNYNFNVITDLQPLLNYISKNLNSANISICGQKNVIGIYI